MAEIGRVEVKADVVGFGKINPDLEVFGGDLIAVNLLALVVKVDGVDIDFVLAGD